MIWISFEASLMQHSNKYVSYRDSTQLNYDLHINLYPSIFCPFHASCLGTLILYKKKTLIESNLHVPFLSSSIVRRPQGLKTSPTFFFELRSMYITWKQIGIIFQHFLAFSEDLNFIIKKHGFSKYVSTSEFFALCCIVFLYLSIFVTKYFFIDFTHTTHRTMGLFFVGTYKMKRQSFRESY